MSTRCMSEDTAIQTQDDEKLALQSIFGEDAVWMPLDVTIHLEPIKTASQLETREVFVFIDLRVKCSRTYPHSTPVISFVNSKGIPQDDLKILLTRLSKRSTELLGNPMILELCEEIRQFLYEKNEPPKGSFHDTMLKKKAIVESEMKRQRANSEKQELEMIAEEKKRLIQQAEWKRDAENEEKADGDPRIIGGKYVVMLNNIPSKRKQFHPYCKEWTGYFNGSSETSFLNEYHEQLVDFIKACRTVKNIEELIDHPYLIQDLAVSGGSSSYILHSAPTFMGSRLTNEFFIMEWLGKGGFGDVKKTSHLSAVNDGESILPTRIRNIEAMLDNCNSGVGTTEWSTSYKVNDNQSSLANSDDDEDYLPVRTLFSPTDNVDDNEFGIYFETSSSKDEMCENDNQLLSESKADQCSVADLCQVKESEDTSYIKNNLLSSSVSTSRLLYIQMEYCERSTLRARIDSKNLIGLQYIHQQGMIHRDIKPMNILLDGLDRVKIGDFGLATRDLILMKNVGNTNNQEISQTRDIGTELYMAPELFIIDDNKPYTAKIDVYSTGIVLFEMFYNPLPPGMERISTIRNLKKDCEFPRDFGCNFTDIQACLYGFKSVFIQRGKMARKLVEWMLRSNAEERPSVDELLSSDHLPLPDTGDEDFQNIFLKTIRKRSGRLYNWIMESICKEEPSKALTYCFDQEICRDKFASSRDRDIEALRQDLSSILRLHSFEPVQTHLLVPSISARQTAGGIRTKPAQMFDIAGFPLSLPVR
uniref:Non-specific serine/threonine protein kinase n=1 Tax=Heterorhabditis bacteriophora TaxID=37862 RepID=A0A1I7XJ05_HETBA